MPIKDTLVRAQDDGRYTQHVTSGGDEYVVDHADGNRSGILSSEEEHLIEAGTLYLSDIICDYPDEDLAADAAEEQTNAG